MARKEYHGTGESIIAGLLSGGNKKARQPYFLFPVFIPVLSSSLDAGVEDFGVEQKIGQRAETRDEEDYKNPGRLMPAEDPRAGSNIAYCEPG